MPMAHVGRARTGKLVRDECVRWRVRAAVRVEEGVNVNDV
jgi:hypothetical protein